MGSCSPRAATLTALRLSSMCASRGHRRSHWWSGCRWPGCSPGSSFPGHRGCCAHWSRCRWCCRRSSAAWRCCWPSAGAASSGGTSTVVRHHAAVHHAGRRSSRRRSWRCRSSSSRSRGRCASADRGLEEAAATLRRLAADGLPAGHAAADRVRRCVAGAVLCWARALGEFGATITFAGNFPGTHADHAARGLPGAGDRPRGGHRAEPGAARRRLSSCWPRCATGGFEAAASQ